MNTIKNLSNLETISTQQSNCVKGGLTDTRGGKAKPSTLTGIIIRP